MTPARARWRLAVAGLVVTALLAGCGGSGEPPTRSTDAGGPAAGEVQVTSPVDGVVVRLQSEGLTKVIGFRLRTDSGQELAFTMGKLENAVEFPPGHLAEHMAAVTRIRVSFREEAGARVVYRLEDAP